MSLGRETHAISDSAGMLAPNPSCRMRHRDERLLHGDIDCVSLSFTICELCYLHHPVAITALVHVSIHYLTVLMSSQSS